MTEPERLLPLDAVDGDLPAPDLLPARRSYGGGIGAYGAGAGGGAGGGASGGGASGGAPLQRLHQVLRGRYWLAAILMCLGLIGGTAGGYFTSHKEYTSRGWIHIRPVLKGVLTAHDDMMPMFESFVRAQVTTIRSRRVIDMAMHDPRWKKFGRGLSDPATEKFIDALNVDHSSGSEYVIVSFIDLDPAAAQTAVHTVIDAYQKIYDEYNTQSQTDRLRLLDARRTTLSTQLQSFNEQILQIAKQYGSDGLEQMYQYKLQELNKIEQRLKALELAVAMAQGATGQTGEVAAQTQPAAMSIEDLIATNPHVAELYQQRLALQSSIEQLRRRLGPDHPRVKDAEQQLSGLDARIQTYANAVRHSRHNLVGSSSGGQARTMAQLVAQRDRVSDLYDDLQKETLDLGRKNLNIKQLRQKADHTQQLLAATKARLDQLSVEASVSGRVEVQSTGDRPTGPSNPHDRRNRMILGGGGGAMGGLAIVLIFGFLDRRLRSVDEASSLGHIRLLGILPALPGDLSDPTQAMMAGQCVHHIRAMLQIGSRRDRAEALMVTGPTVGTGKTSLTLALGLSYAAAGCRTLLVDGDLIGGALSRRVNTIIRRKIGQVLLRDRAITEAELQQALEHAQTSGLRLGDALLALGMVDESQLDAALSQQNEVTVGLLDALEGEPLEDCITATGIRRLSILPLGDAKGHDISRVSPVATRRLLGELRGRFDIVLVDVGPMPGSVETSIITAEVDGVVLIVSRGDQRPHTERTINYLHSLGADVRGLVFNRADERDVAAAYSSSQSFSRPEPRPQPGEIVVAKNNGDRFGPIAQAVASSGKDDEEG